MRESSGFLVGAGIRGEGRADEDWFLTNSVSAAVTVLGRKAEAGSGFAGAGGLFGIVCGFRRVFAATTGIGIVGAPSRSRFGAAFVAHLRGQPAHAVLVEQVPE